jgi:Leucine-rich repeat (LRR) protein
MLVKAHSPHIRTFDFTGCVANLDDTIMKDIAVLFHHSMTTLVCAGCFRLSDNGIRSLSKTCVNLTDLNLSDLHRVTDEGLEHIPTSLTLLKSLNLSGVIQLTDAGVCPIVLKCGQLQHFDLSRCVHLTGLVLLKADQAGLLGHLLTLKLNSMCVSNDSATHFLGCCLKVRVLSLSRCSLLEDGGIRSLAERKVKNMSFYKPTGGLAGLISLDLSHCSLLTDVSLGWVASSCERLKMLDISYCIKLGKTTGMKAIAEHLLRLQDLRMAHCPLLVNQSLVHIAKSHLPFAAVDISGCGGLNDVSVTTCCRQWKSLRSLDVSRLKITNQSVYSVARHIHGIVSLRLSECVGVDDKGIKCICRFLRQLRLLAVDGTGLSDEACGNLNSLGQLRNLDLSRCQLVSGQGLRHIKLDHLETLHMKDVQRLSNGGLASLGGMPSLTHLDVSNNCAVNNHEIDSLLRTRAITRLKHLDCTATQVTISHLRALVDNPYLRKWSLLEPIFDDDFHGLQLVGVGKEVAAFREFGRAAVVYARKADTIRRCWKAFLARKALSYMRSKVVGMHRVGSAIVLQRNARMWASSYRWARIRQAVLQVQVEWRAFVLYKVHWRTRFVVEMCVRVDRVLRSRLALQLWRMKACQVTFQLKVDAFARRHQATRRTLLRARCFVAWKEKIRAGTICNEFIRHRSAKIIQMGWKRKLRWEAEEAMRIVALRAQQEMQRKVQRDSQSCIIQSYVRRWRCIHWYAQVLQTRRLEEHRSAVVIQTHCRGRASKRAVLRAKMATRMCHQISALKISHAFRALEGHMYRQNKIRENTARVMRHIAYGAERLSSLFPPSVVTVIMPPPMPLSSSIQFLCQFRPLCHRCHRLRHHLHLHRHHARPRRHHSFSTIFDLSALIIVARYF